MVFVELSSSLFRSFHNIRQPKNCGLVTIYFAWHAFSCRDLPSIRYLLATSRMFRAYTNIRAHSLVEILNLSLTGLGAGEFWGGPDSQTNDFREFEGFSGRCILGAVATIRWRKFEKLVVSIHGRFHLLRISAAISFTSRTT